MEPPLGGVQTQERSCSRRNLDCSKNLFVERILRTSCGHVERILGRICQRLHSNEVGTTYFKALVRQGVLVLTPTKHVGILLPDRALLQHPEK